MSADRTGSAAIEAKAEGRPRASEARGFPTSRAALSVEFGRLFGRMPP